MAIDFSWFSDIKPWVQGGLGGAAVTFLWQAVLKPGRDRRSLAHVLSEEMAQNLNLATWQLALIREGKPPECVRAWHSLSSIVFESVVERLGELPRLISKIVAIYQVLEVVNRYPPMILPEWDEIRPILSSAPGSLTNAQTQKLNHMNGLYATFEDWLDKFRRYCDQILPEVRKASIPWYRVDRLLCKRSEYILPDLAGKENIKKYEESSNKGDATKEAAPN